MEDLELYTDEEIEAAEEEGSNRTFIILVGALGSVLVLGICAFAAWAFWLGPRMQEDREAQNQAILATNTAIAAKAAAMDAGTATIPPTDEATTVPTSTPRPTLTKLPAAVPATETAGEGTETAGEGTETPEEGTETPQAAPNPTATRRPTATPKPSNAGVPNTGIGALGGGALAVGLLFLLLVVRRMRRAM